MPLSCYWSCVWSLNFAHTCGPTLSLSWQHCTLVTNSNQPQAMTTYITYYLILFYEHKTLHVCDHEALHTTLPLSLQRNIIVTNSSQPQAMTTYLLHYLILFYEHKALCMCDHETLHTHVVQHYHFHGNIAYS